MLCTVESLSSAARRRQWTRLVVQGVEWVRPAVQPWVALRQVLDQADEGASVECWIDDKLDRVCQLTEELESMASTSELYRTLGRIEAKVDALEQRVDRIDERTEQQERASGSDVKKMLGAMRAFGLPDQALGAMEAMMEDGHE